MPGVRSTGTSTLWMPPLFALISTPPAPAGPAPSGGEAPDEALGRSQGGFSTKLHLRAEGGGKPIIAVLTGGERHEQIALEGLLDGGAIRRSGRGRPRLRPRRLAGDKGYSSPTARRWLRQRQISPVIPTRKDQRRQPSFDREAYRERNKVERLINRLKQFRRIATRYEERARASAVLIESEAMRRDGFVIPLSRPSLEEMSDDQVLLAGSAATGGALC
jgi:transposase